MALAISLGHDQPVADILAFLSVAAVIAGLRQARRDGDQWPFSLALAWGVALASVTCAGILSPGVYLEASASLVPFFGLNAIAMVVVGSYGWDLFGERRLPTWVGWGRPAAMVLAALGVAAWSLRVCPAPRIDVWVLDQQAAEALLHGRQVYGHGAIAALDTYDLKRVIDTYDYPPLTLVLSTAAYALTGDTRWAQVAAFVVGALLLRVFAVRMTDNSRLADLLMACALFHPSAMFVLQQAWGEPLAVPFLGAFAIAATGSHRRWAAIPLGLLCALKQHLLLYVPALALLPGVGLPGAAIALGVVAATYVPFAWVSPRGLWESVVLHHLNNPFRPDSLSLPAMLSNAGIFLPSWLGFVATGASLTVLKGMPRSVGPLLLAASLQFLVFYVLGRQAFCNYYYLLGPTWLFAASALVRPVVEVL